MSVTVIDVWVSDSRIDSIEGQDLIGKSSYEGKDVMVGPKVWISWRW